MNLTIAILGIIAGIAAGVAAGFLLSKTMGTKHLEGAKSQARAVLQEAAAEADRLKREKLTEAKEEIFRLRQEVEREGKERRAELQRAERRLEQKEENLDKKTERVSHKEDELKVRHEELDARMAEAEALMPQVPDWTLSDDALRISKKFKFEDFKGSMAFVNKVADLAEAEGHHPDITINWNRVTLDLTTHAIKGLSNNDFIIAAKTDVLLA